MNDLEAWIAIWLEAPDEFLRRDWGWEKNNEPFPNFVRNLNRPGFPVPIAILQQLFARVRGLGDLEVRICDCVLSNLGHPLPETVAHDLVDREICVTYLAHTRQANSVLDRLVPLVEEALLTKAGHLFRHPKHSAAEFAAFVKEHENHSGFNWMIENLAHQTPSNAQKMAVWEAIGPCHPNWARWHEMAEQMRANLQTPNPMQNLFNLEGKTAAVLGGTGELGGAMALALAAHGANVAILGRNAENGAAKVRMIERIDGRAQFFAADALDKTGLRETRDEIEKSFGEISILVNAAGGNKPGATLPPGKDFCKLDLEAWNEVFDLNLVGGALIPAQVFGEKMVERGEGSIINIASMSGMIPLSRVVAYSAAKAAVLNLTMFLAREWAPNGVRVNAISPGFFPAEQNKKLLFNDDGSYSARGQSIITHTPMARFGTAEELGGAVVFLASKGAAGFVTGQNLVVDGGFSSTTI